MTMVLVETLEVGAGGAASIEFTSIPQDADDLLLVLSSRSSTVGNQVRININNDTTTTYTSRYLYGTGSTAASGTYSGTRIVWGLGNDSNQTANTFDNGSAYFSNYTSSTDKSVSMDLVSENNATDAEQNISAGIYPTSSPITSIQLSHSGDFVQYSTASLYKITKA